MTGDRPKPAEINDSHTEDMKEDLKLLKRECDEVKAENIELRKKLIDASDIRKETLNLRKQYSSPIA